MRAKVTDQGVLIPKQWFEGIDEVEIHREQDLIFIEPVAATDPVLSLGTQPIVMTLRSIMIVTSPSHDFGFPRYQLSARTGTCQRSKPPSECGTGSR